jgi:predicted nucleotidyltransferase component of viral defense system
MISKTTIEQLVQRYQTDEMTVVREYFQHLFLSYFYQEAPTDQIYFKGGTALRIIYQSPRFSEDLDFSATIETIIPIENAVIATLAQLEKEGITAEIEESKPTTGGYIGIIRLSGYGLIIPIRLEVSLRRGKKAGETVVVVNDYIPSYTVVRLLEKELIGEKITALLTRQKPRDFYDFYFLLRSRLLQEKSRETFETVLKALQKSPIHFDSELKAFLPKSHHMIIRDFKKTLTQEIKHYL